MTAGSCAPPPQSALAETVRRLEIRVAALEWRLERAPAPAAEKGPSGADHGPPPTAVVPAPPPAPVAASPSPASAVPPAPASKPPPASPPNPLPDDAMREPGGVTLSGAITLTGPYASAGGRGVALLQPLRGKMTPRPRRARLEQFDRDFVPRILAVPVGSTVSFPNRDPVFHNVFSLSETQPFDLGVFKQGESRDVTFERPGVIQVLCNLHASMSAYIVVHKEPYAAVADRAGRFSFPDLPEGRYRLVVWHERASESSRREVTVASGVSRLSIPLVADQAPVVPPNKEGKPRVTSPAQQRPRL